MLYYYFFLPSYLANSAKIIGTLFFRLKAKESKNPRLGRRADRFHPPLSGAVTNFSKHKSNGNNGQVYFTRNNIGSALLIESFVHHVTIDVDLTCTALYLHCNLPQQLYRLQNILSSSRQSIFNHNHAPYHLLRRSVANQKCKEIVLGKFMLVFCFRHPLLRCRHTKQQSVDRNEHKPMK